MTDFSSSDDELISSYLDGEASAHEVARVENDPVLLARAEELGAASEIIATPVTPLRTGDTDRIIAAALAESDTTKTVTYLKAARRRGQRFQPHLVTVAAGVLLIALAVPALIAINNSTDSDTTVADAATESFRASDDDASDDPADDGDDSSEAAASTVPEEAGLSALDGDADASDDGADRGDDADGDFLSDDTAPVEQFVGATSERGLFNDLLGDDAGPFIDDDELVSSASAGWDAYLARGAEPDEQTDGGSLPESDPDPHPAVPCSEEVRLFFGEGEHTFDIGVVEISGQQTTIGIAIDTEAGTARLAIASPPGCEPVDLAILG